MFFSQEPFFLIPRGIIPKNSSSLGFTVLEQLRNKQTHSRTDSQGALIMIILWLLLLAIMFTVNFVGIITGNFVNSQTVYWLL